MRRAALAAMLAAAVAGCAANVPLRPAVPPVAAEESVPPPGTCRVGPDGGMPVADRGIGGTGIDGGIGGTGLVADRGIGGTGGPQVAGGQTGIVGVITGFASVCLAGQEVQYAPGLPVLVDGRPAPLGALRAGQVAVVVAAGVRPQAVSLVVRHEVSGPVQGIEAGGTLRVAGQMVVPPPGGPAPKPGDWVLVSGFRREDGAVVATRIDARGPGEVLIRGIMRSDRGRLWIGLTEVRPGRFQLRQSGIPVVAIGRLNDGVLEADTVEADALLVDPAVFFGPAVGVVFIEGYAEGGFLRFGRGWRFGAPFGPGRAIARLERRGGVFAPAFVRPYGGGVPGGGFGPAPRAAFQPAPLPNRGMDRPAGRFGAPGRSRPDSARARQLQGQEAPNDPANADRGGDRGADRGPGRQGGFGSFGGMGSFGGFDGFRSRR